MANKRIRNYDDGSANVASTDMIGVDRAGLDELERVTLAQAVTAGGTGVFQPLDADLTALAALTAPATKLAGIEAGADVTDATNVAAAGALMDGTAALDDLADVTITTPSSGQVLKFNGSAWVNGTDATGGGGGALDDVTDVTITSPADNEVLAYDNGTSTWINQTAAEAGLAAASHNHDATYQPLDADLTALAAAGNSSVLAATTASFTTADETKLDGIEAGADATDEANVLAAISGATTTAVTPAAGDKVLVLDASDSDNLKHVAFSDFGGGGGAASAWIPSGSMWLQAGGSVNTVVSSALSVQARFDGTAVEQLIQEWYAPVGWEAFKATVLWTAPTSGVGQGVRWQLAGHVAGDGDDIKGAATFTVAATGTAQAVDLLDTVVLTAAQNITAERSITLVLSRQSTHAEDTYAADAGFIGLLLEKVDPI